MLNLTKKRSITQILKLFISMIFDYINKKISIKLLWFLSKNISYQKPYYIAIIEIPLQFI